jgi:hypothetical protein
MSRERLPRERVSDVVGATRGRSLHIVEMFGFKLNPVATKTGGQAKSQGRPIYLDMQVSS